MKFEEVNAACTTLLWWREVFWLSCC